MSESHYLALRVFHQNERMMAMIGGVRDEAGTAAYLERHLVHWREHGFGFWMLRDAESGESAGLAGLRRLTVDGADEVEVGYGFLPAYWGRGLATEIARECVDRAFGQLPLSSIVALTSTDNVASHGVLRKVGLAHERDLVRDGGTAMLFRGGRPPAIERQP